MTAESDNEDRMAYGIRLLDVADEPKKLLLPIEGYEQMPLVTLEEAIEPIANLLLNIEQRVYIAKHNSENPKGGLTVDFSAAIMLYTMGKSSDKQPLYYILNSILRSDQPDRSDQLEPWFLYLKLFITALSYIPSYRGTVYRGVKRDMSDYYIVGKTFCWWAFSSCTKSLSVLQSELFLGQQGEATLFVIDCFSGKEIGQYSQYEKENEVLLVAARAFEVIGSLNPKPHLWIIQVKEVTGPFPFLTMDSSISEKLETSTIGDANRSANICSKCSKSIAIVPDLDAETSTDDLPYNIKLDKETSTDEKLNTDNSTQMEVVESKLSGLPLNNSIRLDTLNSTERDDEIKKSQVVEGDSSASPPLVLMNSTNNQATSSPHHDDACMHTTINFDSHESIQPAEDDTVLTKLYFRNISVTEEFAKTIGEEIRQNAALEIIFFCRNELKDAALRHIIQAIVGRSRLKIFINDNKITDQSATLIADILSSAPQAISQLNLNKNCITNQGVKSIMQVLSNTPNSGLKALSLSGNLSINDACIDDVIRVFDHNRILISLYLEKCNLSDAGKKRLRLAIAERRACFLQL